MTRHDKNIALLLIVLIILHFTNIIVHAYSHQVEHINLDVIDWIVILPFDIILPLLCLYLISKDRIAIAYNILLWTMIISFSHDTIRHFILNSPDRIDNVKKNFFGHVQIITSIIMAIIKIAIIANLGLIHLKSTQIADEKYATKSLKLRYNKEKDLSH